MDHSASREYDVDFDLESGIVDPVLKLCDRFTSVDIDDSSVKSDMNPLNVFEVSPENNAEAKTVGNIMGKEKRKKGSSAKKPPRPPRAFSLDVYDQKLIKELTQLAMIKRARIERMKALKQKRALKTSSSSSSSSSSHGTFFAMIFTIIFFLVILLHGRSSGVTFQGSPQAARMNENGLTFSQNQLSPSASDSISPNSKSSKLF